jgi:pantoate--beta-alanine ligase
MLLFKKVTDLQNYLSTQRKAGKSIGLTPTMGALHAGHVSLVNSSNAENDISVVSIFVNPTQFNESTDLDKYPRTEGADIEKLTVANCAILFMPNVEEVYPKSTDNTENFEFGDLVKVMEGAERPGHFEGVVQVVKRLLEIVQPNRLYMGQKDYQQFAIIQEMIHLWGSDIQIVRCPIVRETDGLAMSSRNVRLTPDHRERAVILSKILAEAASKRKTHSVAQIEKWAMDKMAAQKGFKPEYFIISDGKTLQQVSDFSKHEDVVACLACWAGDVRLIDNWVF